MSALSLPPRVGVIEHLAYPPFFTTILGAWYLLARLTLPTPRFPRLKEWAYAGLIFDYTGAEASHLAVGMASSHWWLRPSSPASRLRPRPHDRQLEST